MPNRMADSVARAFGARDLVVQVVLAHRLVHGDALDFLERRRIEDDDRAPVGLAFTGPGIKAEDMALLFAPFRQIDSTLARKHEGTGLGLAICQRMVGLMGGKIEARSVWGQGSTFTVTLPLQTAPIKEGA